MTSIVIYVGICAVGIFIGNRMRRLNKKLDSISKIQTIVIIFLVTVMGMRIGANKDIISSLGDIGLQAMIISIAGVVGSIAMACIVRKLLKFDKKGVHEDE